jgi:hypothetical protein
MLMRILSGGDASAEADVQAVAGTFLLLHGPLSSTLF